MWIVFFSPSLNSQYIYVQQHVDNTPDTTDTTDKKEPTAAEPTDKKEPIDDPDQELKSKRQQIIEEERIRVLRESFMLFYDKLMENYQLVCPPSEENETEAIVVGVPYTMKGHISKQTVLVLEFMEQLKMVSAIPVKGIDERLSSVAAEKALHQQAVKTGHEKGRIDETAAAILLQEYLDSQS